MIKVIIAVIGFSLLSTLACAEDCKAIQDAAARLACFDKPTISKPPAPKTKKSAAAVDEFSEAKAVIQRKLTDPESARFDDLFKVQTGRGEAICGLVNSKNRMGGYSGSVGFIFERASRSGTMMFSGDSDPDYSGAQAAAYCIYCTATGRGDRNIVDYCPGLIKAYRR
jgi:hypothetical protein